MEISSAIFFYFYKCNNSSFKYSCYDWLFQGQILFVIIKTVRKISWKGFYQNRFNSFKVSGSFIQPLRSYGFEIFFRKIITDLSSHSLNQTRRGAPVDKRPSTDYLHHLVKIIDISFSKILVTWHQSHMTCDMLHMTYDTLHMAFSQISSSYPLRFVKCSILEINPQRMNKTNNEIRGCLYNSPGYTGSVSVNNYNRGLLKSV